METFKQRMKRARLRAGFTSQGEAAEAIGCERGTVSMWEAPSSATESVSSEYMLPAARAYKVKPEWLNDGGDDGYPWTGHIVEARGSAKAPRSAAAAMGLVHGTSQAVRLDVGKLAGLIELVEGAVADSRKPVTARLKARMIAALYADETGGAPDTRAVTTALATLLATLEDA